MTASPEHHEAFPTRLTLHEVTEQLQDGVRHCGSFEELVLSLQDVNSGEESFVQRDTEGAVPIMQSSEFAPVIDTIHEKNSSTGRLYQALRLADYLVGHKDTAGSSEFAHAFYAGELIALTAIDLMTLKENNVPTALLDKVTKLRDTYSRALIGEKANERRRQGDTPGLLKLSAFLNAQEQYTARQAVADEMIKEANAFAQDDTDAAREAKELINSLIQGLPVHKILLIQSGFWLVMKEWIKPDANDLEATLGAIDGPHIPRNLRAVGALAEVAQATLIAGPPTESLTPEEEAAFNDIEEQLFDSEIDYDVTEWNREDLVALPKSVQKRATFIRAHTSQRYDEDNPATASMLRRTLSDELSTYVKAEFGLEQEDLMYAHGSFVASANSTFPDAPADQEGSTVVSTTENHAFTHQNITNEDYRALTGDKDAEIREYEVRGTFDKIVTMRTISDKDSYTIDTADLKDTSSLTYESFVPAVRLLNVSIIDMRRGIAVEHTHDMVIPLNHSHLKLGRFVPPAPESE